MSFFVAPHAVAALLLARDRSLFRRYLLATGLLLLVGSLVFVLVPTDPPWRAGPPGGSTFTVHRVAHDVLAGSRLPTSPGPSGAPQVHFAFDPNPVASLPSIHLGVTVLIAAAAMAGRWLRTTALIYATAMGLSLVYLGEHHVLDVLAGAALAGWSWRVAGRIAPTGAPQRPRPPEQCRAGRCHLPSAARPQGAVNPPAAILGQPRTEVGRGPTSIATTTLVPCEGGLTNCGDAGTSARLYCGDADAATRGGHLPAAGTGDGGHGLAPPGAPHGVGRLVGRHTAVRLDPADG